MAAAVCRVRRNMPFTPTDVCDNLERFVDAQDDDGIYRQALTELLAGRKRSHWMWFVFPQIAGLGNSPTAKHYAISSLDEARAYLGHPVLGPRLVECAHAVLEHPEQSAAAILGETDALKLRSSMTLFARAGPGEPVFRRVLDRYFDGAPDSATDERV